GGIPQLHCIIVDSAGQDATVGRVSDLREAKGLTLKGDQHASRGDIPQPYCSVPSESSQSFAVRGKRGRMLAWFRLNCGDNLLGLEAPQLQIAVRALRRESIAVGREENKLDVLIRQSGHLASRVNVPQLDRTDIACGQGLPFRRKDHGLYVPLMRL